MTTLLLRRRTLVTAEILGVVEHGDERGRLLGFPTANLPIEPDAPIDDGVYAASVRWRHHVPHLAAVSIGTRPTVYAAGRRLVEVHLLDVTADLYGETLRVRLEALVRPQRRFPDLDALRGQLADDVAAVRRLLDTIAA